MTLVTIGGEQAGRTQGERQRYQLTLVSSLIVGNGRRKFLPVSRLVTPTSVGPPHSDFAYATHAPSGLTEWASDSSTHDGFGL